MKYINPSRPRQPKWYHQNESINMNTLKTKTWLTIAIVVLATAILVAIYWYVNQVDRIVAIPKVYATGAGSKSAELEEVTSTTPSQEEIENYIRTIFGKDSRVGIAVSHNECNPANKQYPYCILHTDAEYSVGIWQINLFNAKHWIHAKKVPGTTMEEKIEWLKDPYNNTLIAYKIFSDQGFGPWSAYTSGNYKRSL